MISNQIKEDKVYKRVRNENTQQRYASTTRVPKKQSDF
jgi:hypothetical protein